MLKLDHCQLQGIDVSASQAQEKFTLSFVLSYIIFWMKETHNVSNFIHRLLFGRLQTYFIPFLSHTSGLQYFLQSHGARCNRNYFNVMLKSTDIAD
jgi:hypothetical protein